MSPINSALAIVGTPKIEETGPFRTPRSVRRNQAASNERILGTPDYLGPELLLQYVHIIIQNLVYLTMFILYSESVILFY